MTGPGRPGMRRLHKVLLAVAACALIGTVFGPLAPSPARGDKPSMGAGKPSERPSVMAGSSFRESPTGAARFRGLFGYAALIGLAWLLSQNRKKIRWRPVAWGLALQLIFAFIVLNPVMSRFFFDVIDRGVRKLLSFAEAGMDFVFQSTVPHKLSFIDQNGDLVTKIFVGQISPALKSFAFWILPTVIFFSALITVLYHLGVMQWIVKGIARAMVYALRTSGAETLSCTANIFVGQTEAPLMVKPFVDKMTKSELMAVMIGGFATVAGGVLAIYVSMLKGVPGAAGHLVIASIMAAPCALAIAKIVLPETEEPATGGALNLEVERPDANVIEAAARGASEGMTLVLNIGAMLIAFVGLVAMINAVLGLLGGGLAWMGILPAGVVFSLENLLGWALSPLAWAMGVPWGEATTIGGLMGEKLVLTELISYLHLKSLLAASTPVLCHRSAVIGSYALCGFANVASIGIQIGGIGGMAPNRRGELAQMGLRAMFAGAIVSCISGTIAGMLV